jgi:hypothetical protein
MAVAANDVSAQANAQLTGGAPPTISTLPFNTGAGSNQYMNSYPTIPSPTGSTGTNSPNVMPSSAQTTPGVVPQTQYPTFSPTTPSGVPGSASPGSGGNLQGGNQLVPTMDPNLTSTFMQWLQTQLGQGLPAFNLSATLPTGGTTTPGAVSAPENSMLQQLQSFLTGGSSSMPGASGLTTMATTGDPTSQLPAWQAMVQAMGQNTAQNEANLAEQFGTTGSLGSSEYGTAMSNFQTQNTLNQNALLGQMQATASENAANRELSAQQGLQSEASGMGQYLQGLDQQSIQNLYNEYMTTLPQTNPILSLLGTSALTEPSVAGSSGSSLLGGIGSILGGLGSIAGAGGTSGIGAAIGGALGA